MSENLPLVCICVPTYNAAATVRETLKSILNQSYRHIVVHVSDNASTDNTMDIVRSIADSRLQFHVNAENVGGEGNFNRCIQLAEGKYTALFHADDIYEPDMVAKQVEFLEKNSVAGAVFTEAGLIDDTGRNIGEIRIPKDISRPDGLYDFATMFKAVLRHSNFLICPSFMVRTQIYREEVKVWRGEQFGSGADLDVWLRILQHHHLGHISEKLMRYRISDKQFTAQVRLKTEPALIFKIINHYLRQNAVKTLLDESDYLNLKRLERRDRVGRAVNLYLMDTPDQAYRLLDDVFSREALEATIQTKRGLLTFIVGAYVRLLLISGCTRVGKRSLAYMKRVTHR